MMLKQLQTLKAEFEAILARHHGQHTDCELCQSYQRHVTRLRDEGYAITEAHRIARGAVGLEIVRHVVEEVN
jgi:hypothetical protein